MKKGERILKNRMTAGRLLAFGLVLLMVLTGCSAHQEKEPLKRDFTEPADMQKQEGTVYLSKGNTGFTLDCHTTHFTVQDKAEHITLTSLPAFDCNSDSEETKKRFTSELVLTYYDENSQKFTMYSTADSVEKGNFQVFAKEDAVRVIYEFGAESSELLVPEALTEEWWNTLTEVLSASQKRRLKLYYTLYSESEPPEDYEEMSAKNPVLKEMPLYLLNKNISDVNRMDISEYMSLAGYSQADYTELAEKLGIAFAGSDTPGFTVPVEYTIQEDGFSAAILFDQIVEKSKKYVLTDVELLPSFAAEGSDAKGRFIVPDGSGAIIPMNTTAQGSYVHAFYGEDPALRDEETTMLIKNQYLPMCASTSRRSSLLMMIEGAAPVAQLTVETLNASNPANAAAVTFHYRARYSTSNNGMNAISGEGNGKYNLYRDYELSETPTVRYCLRSPDMTDIELAGEYRKILSDQNHLPDGGANGGILLDFYCVCAEKKSVLGVSYQKTVVLTTFRQIREVLETMTNAGIRNISVRLCAYQSEGLDHAAYTSFDFEKKIGEKSELADLITFVRKNGGELYLEADFQTAYCDTLFDGYSQRGDSAYTAEEKLAHTSEYQIVTRKPQTEKSGYLVSPVKYPLIAKSFLNSLAESDLPENTALSFGNAGKLLTGTYASSAIDRTTSVAKINEVLKNCAGRNLLIGGGNMYAARYANRMTDIDMFSSLYDLEEEAIPFWQAVYHGLADYSSSPFNTSDNWQLAFLKSLEYGSIPHYALIGISDDEALAIGIGTRPYSMSMKERLAQMTEECSQTSEYYQTVSGDKIIAHAKLRENVYITTYSDGSSMIVNYSESPYRDEKGTVEPLGFRFEKGSGK